jgi:signal transduction histidine kinase
VAKGDGPVWASADPALARRVLDNLLSNALTYAPAGTPIEVVTRVRPEGIELSVCDRGPGVPVALREKVFEKYARVGEGGDGTNRGLGLTFCRLAIEAHGGTIWVEETKGGGACFRAVLPAAVAETIAGRRAAPLGA